MASQNPMTDGVGGIPGNGTATAEGFLAVLVNEVQRSPATYIIATLLLALGIAVTKLSNPTLDAREPPLWRPKIPVIGHLIGMIRHGPHYFKTIEREGVGIATLPILNGKLYGVWDPFLANAVNRNKDLLFEPFAVDFAQLQLGFRQDIMHILADTDIVKDVFESIRAAMTAPYVRKMNARALNYVSDELQTIAAGKPLELPNLYLWLRDLMSLATTEALYGHENPLRKDPSLLKEVWVFDEGLTGLMFTPFNKFTQRRTYQARARLQAALANYYGPGMDANDDVAQLVKNRANAMRKNGMLSRDVGEFEIALLHVATSNTIPTLFWFVAHVFHRPDLVASLMDEVLPVVQHGGDGNVTIDIGDIDERCPLLVSCYREAVRICNKGLGNRRADKDTTISDGKGNTYLLKKGSNIQMSQEVFHSYEPAWGPNPTDYVAERFVEQGNGKPTDAEKIKKASYLPFGGGKHLCPGRTFAFAENLGLVAALVVGFEVTLLDADRKRATEMISMDRSIFSSAVVKPLNHGEGLGARIKRRKGWETVIWRFTS
ncbi:Cholesterol 7-alpha-monooxygenase [Colletotrichum sidae]|uniref:Cholesterol 7-alpha-monooxygenase n=1 Tax=Colletotrichum sidae TaxID=1347389 RepID=A0A4R8T313_9PEZI|nr:Cholesterol 7-alpha-monooxygenase [Colletotrichum sidae]